MYVICVTVYHILSIYVTLDYFTCKILGLSPTKFVRHKKAKYEVECGIQVFGTITSDPYTVV